MSEHFAVECPDMQMSAFDPRKENSPARCLLFLFGGGACGCALPAASAAAGSVTGATALAAAGSVTCATALAVVPLSRWCLRKSLDACVRQQAEAIASFKPDVVVASSWGGAVALRLLETGAWAGPTVLMAPAADVSKKSVRMLWPHWKPRIPALAASRCILVHGSWDDTVPVASSREMASQHAFAEFLEMPAGDHRLNDALCKATEEDPKGKLRELVMAASRL